MGSPYLVLAILNMSMAPEVASIKELYSPSKSTRYSVAVITTRTARLKACIAALRVHQWPKNLLIFMPLLLSHQFEQWRLLESLHAFFAFSFCASGFYIFNDLLDRDADRMHPRKAQRPFASGVLRIRQGFALFAACLAAAIALAWTLPLSAQMILLLYAMTALGYSAWLKQIAFVDVLILALLYGFRLLFGGATEGIDVSIWTLVFFAFLFFGLALIKRWAELLAISEFNGGRLPRRGYLSSQARVVSSLARWSLYMSVAVLAFYSNSTAATNLYKQPRLLWLACLLLFMWVRRTAHVTSKGLMADDPLLFAFKDPRSHVIAVLFAVAGALAIGF